MNLSDLAKEMPYQWRVQSAKEYGCDCVAYIDSRDVQKLLDVVCGQDGWQDEYYSVDGKLFCKIGIKCGESWVWKSDCGTESNVEKEKGQASDAFKRAAVKWGIGRFLYEKKVLRVPVSTYKGKAKFYPARKSGDQSTILWDKSDLTNFCESMLNRGSHTKTTTPQQQQPKNMSKPVAKKLKEILEENMDGKAVDMDKVHKVLWIKFKRYPSDEEGANGAANYLIENEMLNAISE